MQHELIGKYCKLVFKDGKREKVIKGIVKDIDDFTVDIVGERDNKLVVIGKNILVSLKEARQNNTDFRGGA